MLLEAIKNKTRTFASDDSGLTLTEFLLVAFFFLFVVILVFQIVYFTQENSKLATRYSVMSNEVGVPLDIMDRYFSQNLAIGTMTPYSVQLTIPQKSSTTNAYTGTNYVVIITAESNGRLTVSRTLLGGTFALSNTNLNVAKGEPLFKFRDKDNKPTTDPAKADVVEIHVISSIPNSDKTVESSRTVLFRNR